MEVRALLATLLYLRPEWPNIRIRALEDIQERKLKSAKCPGCHTKHREVFPFKCWDEGERFGREWEILIVPILKRWGEFMEWYAEIGEHLRRKWLLRSFLVSRRADLNEFNLYSHTYSTFSGLCLLPDVACYRCCLWSASQPYVAMYHRDNTVLHINLLKSMNKTHS